MFKLAGRILDWTDESEEVKKTGSYPLSFFDYALVLEDHDGVTGRRYPITSKEEVSKSMDSFEKYASRLMPLHRRTAATFMAKACVEYDLPLTEKVAMYVDEDIKERTVSYKQAVADYEPGKMSKSASYLVQKIANLPTKDSLDFGVESNFVKQASFEMSSILRECEVCEGSDPLILGLHKLANDQTPMDASSLYGLAQDICKIAGLSINKTILRDPINYPREILEKEASEDSLDEFILDNIGKLKGHFNPEIIEKIAQDPTKVLLSLPEEISKIVANLLTSNE